ncbi:hypothetical protein L1049_014110 [Liquidambar formosana]|uniref:Copper transport protein n=1 Tax=Liquidambar formosana TaxID=63359 RepID=A0AAP0WXD4_LIQFO
MDGMDHDHMHGMDGNHGGGMHDMHRMMMHMTFYWSKNGEILFSGWPGTRTGMYVLSLIFVFALAVVVEWLSHCKLIKSESNDVSAGVVQTLMHGLRMGLAYMVMLAVMSFNVGVFLVAVAGHTVGFLLFGSRVFKRNSSPPPGPPPSGKTSDLPSMSC